LLILILEIIHDQVRSRLAFRPLLGSTCTTKYKTWNTCQEPGTFCGGTVPFAAVDAIVRSKFAKLRFHTINGMIQLRGFTYHFGDSTTKKCPDNATAIDKLWECRYAARASGGNIMGYAKGFVPTYVWIKDYESGPKLCLRNYVPYGADIETSSYIDSGGAWTPNKEKPCAHRVCGSTMFRLRSKADSEQKPICKVQSVNHFVIDAQMNGKTCRGSGSYLRSDVDTSSVKCQRRCEQDDACTVFTFFLNGTHHKCETYASCSSANAGDSGDVHAITYRIDGEAKVKHGGSSNES